MFSCSFLQHHFVDNYFDNYLMYICDKESEEHTMYKQAGKGYLFPKFTTGYKHIELESDQKVNSGMSSTTVQDSIL